MTESEFVEYLQEVFDWSANEDGEIRNAVPFEDAGVLTMNKGLVVRMKNGSKFQVTIVKSK